VADEIEKRYPWVPDYIVSVGKRVGSWICPFCDGLILAPQSPRLHVKKEHPDEYAALAPERQKTE